MENEPNSSKFLDLNATTQPTIEAMIVRHLFSLQHTIYKLGEELQAFMIENGKSKILIVENKHLKKLFEMWSTQLMQHKIEVKQCTQACVGGKWTIKQDRT